MKKIIPLVLKVISRENIQRIISLLRPIFLIIYYGKKYKDPISGKTHRKFLPYGRGKRVRDNALSPSSLSLERHRLLWLYFKEKTNIFNDKIKFLNIAPELCFIKKFKKLKNIDYTTADLSSPWADLHFDAHNIPLKDNTFDFIMANHLLEHVEDDIKVLKEFYRIMKKGGTGIFQVPFFNNNEKTFEDKTITSPKQRAKHFGQEDHLRAYGKDYKQRLEQVGFKVKEDRFAYDLSDKDINYYSLTREIIYLCKK